MTQRWFRYKEIGRRGRLGKFYVPIALSDHDNKLMDGYLQSNEFKQHFRPRPHHRSFLREITERAQQLVRE